MEFDGLQGRQLAAGQRILCDCLYEHTIGVACFPTARRLYLHTPDVSSIVSKHEHIVAHVDSRYSHVPTAEQEFGHGGEVPGHPEV